MKLDLLKKNWDLLGQVDAPYFILSKPGKRNCWDMKEFFETGVKEIDGLMKYVNSNFPNLQKKLALDFGCGIGRLTQALCNYFENAHGVDIAKSMTDKADFYKGDKKCNYFCLDNLDSLNYQYDLIYSNIVLQHMEPKYSIKYIESFFKRLAPNGISIFQLPYNSKQKIIYGPVDEKNFTPRMEMYAVDKSKVISLAPANVKLIEVIEDNDAGPNFDSCKYVFQKKAE